MLKISRLQYITQDHTVFSHGQLIESACIAGVDWIQLRMKNKAFSKHLQTAFAVKEICRKYKAKLIVNDNVLIAKEIEADGVHLGKTDMNPLEARSILGAQVIIGGTANTFEDIENLNKAKVDYIGLGPFRFTSTKENLSPILGLEGYKKIAENCEKWGFKIPIIAIGGIKAEDVRDILITGMYGIAVSSAISFSENKSEVVENFKRVLNRAQRKSAKID